MRIIIYNIIIIILLSCNNNNLKRCYFTEEEKAYFNVVNDTLIFNNFYFNDNTTDTQTYFVNSVEQTMVFCENELQEKIRITFNLLSQSKFQLMFTFIKSSTISRVIVETQSEFDDNPKISMQLKFKKRATINIGNVIYSDVYMFEGDTSNYHFHDCIFMKQLYIGKNVGILKIVDGCNVLELKKKL